MLYLASMYGSTHTNKSNISYLKPAEHSNPFSCSPGSHSQSVICSLGITSVDYLLASSISAHGQPHVYAASPPGMSNSQLC